MTRKGASQGTGHDRSWCSDTPFLDLLYRRGGRFFGYLALAHVASCAFCIDPQINPAAEEHNAYCAEYLAQGSLDQAEARCQLAMEFGPTYAEPRNTMGQIAVARGYDDQAMDWFKEAIALKSDFAEAHNNLGFMWQKKREYDQAADAFLGAIEIDPGYQVARRNYAQMLLYLDRPEKAREEFLKCLEVDPTFCDCRMGLGVIELENERWSAAVGQFERLIQVCPAMDTGWYNLCYSRMQMGECGEAVDACLSAVSINADYIEARKNLTRAYECLALQDEVLNELIGQIRQNPGDPGPHFKLCIQYDEKKLYDRALGECGNAIRLDATHQLAHYRMARILDRMLRTAETVDMCQRFVDLLRGDQYPEQRDWCVDRVRQLQFR